MKKQFLAAFMASAILVQNSWSAQVSTCGDAYEDEVHESLGKMSFNINGDRNFSFSKAKYSAYYNGGQGRTLVGSTLVSMGRVAGATAMGAAAGFAAPYAVAGTMIGVATVGAAVPCVVLLFFSMGWAFESCEYMIPVTEGLVSAGGSIVSAVPPPVTAVIGGAAVGAISAYRSVKDSKLSVKIHRLRRAQDLIDAAYSLDAKDFEAYYKDTFGKRVRSQMGAEAARQFLIAKDSSKSFCQSGQEPMTFQEIRKAILEEAKR